MKTGQNAPNTPFAATPTCVARWMSLIIFI